MDGSEIIFVIIYAAAGTDADTSSFITWESK
jgi:hypothetical protein